MQDRRPSDAVEMDDAESLRSAIAVAEDFAALVVLFERQLELNSEMDEESRSHLIAAKVAAERGAELSGELLRRLRDKD